MDIRTAVSAPLSNSMSASFATATAPSSSAPAPAAAPVSNAAIDPISRSDAEQATKTINRFMESVSKNLEFSVDDDLDKVVVKIVDRTTRDVIRQIPTEEALSISKSLDKLQGLLLNEQA
jgi:flagellar protein FlaG